MNEKPEFILSKIKKILVIQLLPIGDAFLTTSYFQTLKNKIPGVKIHYLIFNKYKRAIENNPLIDSIIEIEESNGLEYYIERIRKINLVRNKKYDLVIDQQNLPATQLITLFSGAKYKMGYEDARFSFAYNLKAKRGPKRYSASKKFDILSPLGIKQEKYELHFNVSKDSEKYISDWLNKNNLKEYSFICVSPGSPVEKKKWKLENYIELISRISKKFKLPIIICWAPNEKSDAEKVFNKLNEKCILAPPTDLMQISALIKKSRLLICNDGGLNHLSVATKTKTLAIFGKTNPRDWSPASEFDTHQHLYNDKIPDDEKDQGFGIGVDEVFNKVEKILNEK